MAKKQPSNTYVALLRGINVGGRNMLPMSKLVAMFLEEGCGGVATYIQSGNVVFRAPATLAARLPDRIEKAITDRVKLRVPVVLRSSAELRRITKANPFLRRGIDESHLHVAFLSGRPAAARGAGLDPAHSPPDEFAIQGSEIYLRCPNGLARTRLTNQYFDSRLGTTSTVRNWRTVLKLLELSEG